MAEQILTPPTPSAALCAEDIIGAIAAGHLSMAYQPQVTPDGRMRGVEALIRWTHPERGVIHPAMFVPLAEKAGIMDALGAFALQQACHDGAGWDSLFVSVNVSPRQFADPTFVECVRMITRHTGMPCERLEIEITENAYFDDFEQAIREVHTLRDLGIRVALDDFGTGYASLTCLRRLPITKVKIDQSFVRDFHGRDSGAIIKAVVGLAEALDLETTAEGVETAEQQKFLAEAGCTLLQGYLFSAPASSALVTSQLDSAWATAGGPPR